MSRIIKLLCIMTLLLASVSLSAQNDSVPARSFLQNAVSDDTPQNDNGIDSHQAVSDSLGGGVMALLNIYNAGKYREALDYSQKLLNRGHLSKRGVITCQMLNVASLKNLEYNYEADSAVRHFLQKEPLYKPTNFEPLSFLQVLDNYYTMPRFSIWLGAGNSFVRHICDTVYVTTVDTMQQQPDYSFSSRMFQIGFEYNIIKWLSVSAAPTLSMVSYTRSISRHPLASYHYDEDYVCLGIPIVLEASLYRGREFFVPSAYVGFQPKIMLKSTFTSYIDYVNAANDDPATGSSLDGKNRINTSLLCGVRFSFNHNRMSYFADIRASHDLNPLNKCNNKYALPEVVFNHLYVPDVIRINEFSLMLGVKVKLKYKTVAKFSYGYQKN
ncbi:MAG: hypothetical protein J6V76_00635 [Bacteroidales bacterium]|nr:hypothetical protein [Bacteroidales bacterium]